MTTTLRVVLDQLVVPTDPDLAMASRELTRALIASAPRGCEVAATVPAAGEDALGAVKALDGLARVDVSPIPRREAATAVSLGLPSGLGAGMVHSPTLFAPLVRHDRVHNHDQTVVTIWDLTPWTHPERLPKASVAWHRAMLKRAQRYADAVVVPLHAMAEELSERTKLGDRLRVIAGAAPEGFAEPRDAVGRRRERGVPEGAVVVDGAGVTPEALGELVAALGREAAETPVVVLDPPPGIAEVAGSAILVPAMDAVDRAAAMASASVLVAPGEMPSYGWRVLEALALGVPVVAAASPAQHELVGEGGTLIEGGADALAASVVPLLGPNAERRRAATLAADRGRAFSWREAGERVWQLHAEL
ncbi:MAG TPA: glycosyl transferase [Microbacterium sp.]|uniref:glycosyltransferase n=1 Tax=unclassified Microbacterium TaxID=2609290 RepID=UPI000C379AA6|nr:MULTISPECIES: glycosyltransferase [unclassified Microbacterium]MBU19453.1 glycosyl transferase [Microbacterium sp.]HBS08656.1 glycosyl transferase [Microbacterium sp.]